MALPGLPIPLAISALLEMITRCGWWWGWCADDDGDDGIYKNLHCWRPSPDRHGLTLIVRFNDDVDVVSFPPLPCPGPDLGHPTNAAGYRGPNSGLHRCWGGDQPDTVGSHTTWLDRLALKSLRLYRTIINKFCLFSSHLLQQESGDPESVSAPQDPFAWLTDPLDRAL